MRTLGLWIVATALGAAGAHIVGAWLRETTQAPVMSQWQMPGDGGADWHRCNLPLADGCRAFTYTWMGETTRSCVEVRCDEPLR